MADRTDNRRTNNYNDRSDMNWLDWLARTLVIVGALNWGLMGLAGYIVGDENAWNVIDMLFGTVPSIEWLIYLLVGLAGLYELYRTLMRPTDSDRR